MLVLGPGVLDGLHQPDEERFAMIVTAMARFMVGVVRARLFDIKLACRPSLPAKIRALYHFSTSIR
jgi:hypothetical protein